MKNTFKFICMFLALALILCAGGCGSSPEASQSPVVTSEIVPEPTAEPTSSPTATPEPTTEPTPDPTPEPTEDPALALAQEILSGMSLKEKAGQMLLVRCPSADAAQTAYSYCLGGYVLFGADFEGKTAAEVIAGIQAVQGAVKLPMLIAVDEEGGTVCRVSSNPDLRPSRFLSPKRLFSDGGWDAIYSDTQEKCDLLRSLGINVNLAPVCDVSSEGSFMYSRSFSSDAGQTAEYVSAVVGVMNENQIGCSLKHFPGYGDNADTHTGSAYDARSIESFRAVDFLPFIAGIEAGAGSVLVSHNVVECMDGARPASMSEAVHSVLRDELGFDGVIITDDLDMDAITEYSEQSGTSPYVMAVLAGNDMLCCSDYANALQDVTAAVADGTLTQARLDESVLRILIWKINLGLISADAEG